MWRNYLTVAFRALAKNKVYAFINILGLAIGLAACLLILLYVQYERSYDDWMPDAARINQVQQVFQSKTTSDHFENQGMPYVAKAALLKDFPQIESSVYMGRLGGTLIKDGQAFSLQNVLVVDGPFFDVFALPMVAGDKQALSRPNTVVFSESEALNRFGTTNIVGQTITLIVQSKKADFRVTGVIKDLPKNSHMAAKALIRVDFPSLYNGSPQEGFLTNWGWNSGNIYLKLRPGVDVATINGQLEAWKKRNIPDSVNNGQRTNPGDERTFNLVNIQDVHLGKAQGSAMTPGNDVTAIATFAIIALLILIMACINFTNLATARAGQRAREVALRKVLGASRPQLIVQFMTESILLTAVSMLVALAITEISMPWFAAFLNADLSVHYLGHGGVLLPIFALTLLVGVAGGLYPAFYLSRFQPARVLKANKSAADAEGSGRLRGALVVIQFAVSIGLMACTAIIYSQTVYARSLDPGYSRDGLIQVPGISSPLLGDASESIVREMAKVPGIQSVGRSSIGVNTPSDSSTGVNIPGHAEPISIGIYAVDGGFLPTVGVHTLAGRVFDANRPADDMTTPFPEDPKAEQALADRGGNIVLNESGVERLGFKNPQDAVGKTIQYGISDQYGGTMKLTVIGVVADARFRTVNRPIEPMMFLLERHGANWMVARYSGDPQTVRSGMETIWRRFAPDLPFNAQFSDEAMAQAYALIDARAQMFAMFSLLAVIIGCLGLFGLAAFTAERRTKEIGIRKVLGARTWHIAQLLIWQFTRPIVVANLIAWPIAWWAMRDWLNRFDARITLTPTPFAAAGLLALMIAMLTIASHAIRVARTNPIHALRYE